MVNREMVGRASVSLFDGFVLLKAFHNPHPLLARVATLGNFSKLHVRTTMGGVNFVLCCLLVHGDPIWLPLKVGGIYKKNRCNFW